MTAQLLDGRATAAQLEAELTVRVRALAAQGVTPGIATVLVGERQSIGRTGHTHQSTSSRGDVAWPVMRDPTC